MRVLITGASGFIGRATLACLSKDSAFEAIGVVRSRSANTLSTAKYLTIPDLNAGSAWAEATHDVDVVIHTAARVHARRENASENIERYRQVNVEGTINVASLAARTGVKRFVFLSSVKVNGEKTLGAPFKAEDQPAPVGPYAISKWEAERRLMQLSPTMEVVILRPVLVYGPGVQANFLSLMRWINRGVPLPFALIDNRRSFVSIANLVTMIRTCITHPDAANQTFLVSDGEDISTPDLARRLARYLKRSARLLPVPPTMLKAGAALIGASDVASRLCDSLQADIGKNQDVLGWAPSVSMDEALKQTAEYFCKNYST